MKALRFLFLLVLPSILTGCVTRTIVKIQEQVPPASKDHTNRD